MGEPAGATVILPPFPEHMDSLALFSLLLVVGLLIGEWLHKQFGWPKLIGYVLAGSLFGPSLLGLITIESLTQARPIADAALGLLMLEVGRRLDLNWLRRNPELLRSTSADIILSFAVIFIFAFWVVGLTPAWAAATAAVTMASAPAVVLLTIEEAKAQGQVTERIILHTSIGSAASFFAFAVVLGVVHAESSDSWLNAIVHPLWVVTGGLAVGCVGAWLALAIARAVPKRSPAQVFVLLACALLAVGIARMLATPVFLTLFSMGLFLASRDHRQTLRYTGLPEGHWLLAIILFVIVGASLPWQEFTWLSGCQAQLAAIQTSDGWRWYPAIVGNRRIHGLRNCRTVSGSRAIGADLILVCSGTDGTCRSGIVPTSPATLRRV